MGRWVTLREAEALRTMREACGMDQATAADRMGCAQATLSRLETGQRQPGTKALADRWRQVINRAYRIWIRRR